MPVDQQKIEQAKKMFGVNDSDIKRILNSQPAQSNQPSPTAPSQPSSPQGSAIPSAAGTFVGGLAGNVGGPVGRIAGVGMGAGIGQQASEMMAGNVGDPLAVLSPLNPMFAIANSFPHAMSQLKGEQPKLSSVEKAQQSGAASQLTGEAIAGLLSLLKPGTTGKIFSNITDYLSEKGKGRIPAETIRTRFLNETLPKAIQSSGEASEAKIIGAGTKQMAERMGAGELLDTAELNFIRKQFNSLGKGAMRSDLTKFLANDIARIIREEQVKKVPGAAATIGAQKLAYEVPNVFRQLPFGRFLLGTGATGNQGILGLLGSGISKVGGALSRYVLPGLMQSGNNQQ